MTSINITPNELLIGLNKENPQVHDAYHLDLTTGELTLVAKNPGERLRRITDNHFKIRGATASTPNGGTDLLIRDTAEENTWRKLLEWGPDDSLNSFPLGFSDDEQSLFLVDARDVNAGRLVRLNIANRNIAVIAEYPQYDVGGVMIPL